MDSERLIRISFPGIALVAYVFFFYILFTGRSGILDIEGSADVITEVLALITATPVLGFIITSVSRWFIEAIIGYRIHFRIPHDDIFNILKERNADIKWPDKYNKDKWYKKFFIGRDEKKQLRAIYIQYMIKRQDITGDHLKFLERRWTIVWLHIHIISGILLALFVNCLIVATDGLDAKFAGITKWTSKEWVLVSVLLLTMFYLFVGIYNAVKIREEAVEVEHGLLKNPPKQEVFKKNKKKKNK